MRIQDSRRLTGFNLLSPRAGAICELRFDPDDGLEARIAAWSRALDRAFEALGWEPMPRWTRCRGDEASLLFDAPLDALYAATEINEWAVAVAGGDAPSLEEVLPRFKRAIAEESNPALIALEAEARRRGLPFVWDDDDVSIGMGHTSQCWAVDALPEPGEVAWEQLGAVPLAYITGTNGKTTSTRMCARIMEAAGKVPGATSSDGVVIGREHVERGDWTGTGAARRVLRHPEVEVALLETARGGMLRRGLVSERCDAALITNVASDHLGEYGIQSVADMAQVKGMVLRAVDPEGRRVLNWDDPLVRALGEQDGAPITWFTMRGMNSSIADHLQAGGEAWLLEDGWLCYRVEDTHHALVRADAIPATFGGAAQHNTANALGAAALCHALGAPIEAISAGLLSFGAEANDNPGRCQLYEHQGVRLILDFGHNPHGVSAMLRMAHELTGERSDARLWVSIGQAGDRSDEDLHGLAEAIADAQPELISLREIVGYERGRAPRESAGIIRESLIARGRPEACIRFHDDESHALIDALDWAKPGDLILHMVHIQREAVEAILSARGVSQPE